MRPNVILALLYGLITSEQAERIRDTLTLFAVIRANPEPEDPVLRAVKLHFERDSTYFARPLSCGYIEITVGEPPKGQLLTISVYLDSLRARQVRFAMSFSWHMPDNSLTTAGRIGDEFSEDDRKIAVEQLVLIADSIPQISDRMKKALGVSPTFP